VEARERRICDADGVAEAIRQLAASIRSRASEGESLAVVGIRRRGDVIAQRLLPELRSQGAADVLSGTLDITFYRDDLHRISPHPVVKGTEVEFDVTGKRVILVDDVLYTGRTVRAALDLLFDLGRPACVELAVIAERPGRELPISADHVIHRLDAHAGEAVEVQVTEIDGADGVRIAPTESA